MKPGPVLYQAKPIKAVALQSFSQLSMLENRVVSDIVSPFDENISLHCLSAVDSWLS
jgi:hypothetical protein